MYGRELASPVVTTAAWVLLAVAGVFAVGDWIAVDRQSLPLEYVCKPAATVAFIATAALLDPAHSDARAWFVAALVFCLFGDVFLMLPDDRLVPGLASFLVAQVLFTVGFLVHPGPGAGAYAAGLVLVGVVGSGLLVRFVGALRRSGRRELVVPLVAYFVAISAMVVSAVGSRNGFAIAGSVLFFVSDAVIGETRFVAPRRHSAVAIMVTYELALAGLVLSLV